MDTFVMVLTIINAVMALLYAWNKDFSAGSFHIGLVIMLILIDK